MSDSWDPMDCSLPGFSVHGISQARILEWVAIFSSRDLPDPRMESMSPALQQGSLHKYNIHTYIYLSDAQILIISANYII